MTPLLLLLACARPPLDVPVATLPVAAPVPDSALAADAPLAHVRPTEAPARVHVDSPLRDTWTVELWPGEHDGDLLLGLDPRGEPALALRCGPTLTVTVAGKRHDTERPCGRHLALVALPGAVQVVVDGVQQVSLPARTRIDRLVALAPVEIAVHDQPLSLPRLLHRALVTTGDRDPWPDERTLPIAWVPQDGHEGAVTAVARGATGHAISGGYDGTARVWDARGVQLAVLRGHQREVTGVALSPDGRLALTGSADRSARLWDLLTGEERAILRGHLDEVRAVAFSPDGRLAVTASHDKTVRVWDAWTGEALHTLSGHGGWVTAVGFLQDARLVSGDTLGSVRLWDARSGEALGAHEPGVKGVVALVPVEGGVVALADPAGGEVVWWDVDRSAETGRWPHPGVRDLARTADGTVSVGRDVLRVQPSATDAPPEPAPGVVALAAGGLGGSLDGRVARLGDDDTRVDSGPVAVRGTRAVPADALPDRFGPDGAAPIALPPRIPGLHVAGSTGAPFRAIDGFLHVPGPSFRIEAEVEGEVPLEGWTLLLGGVPVAEGSLTGHRDRVRAVVPRLLAVEEVALVVRDRQGASAAVRTVFGDPVPGTANRSVRPDGTLRAVLVGLDAPDLQEALSTRGEVRAVGTSAEDLRRAAAWLGRAAPQDRVLVVGVDGADLDPLLVTPARDRLLVVESCAPTPRDEATRRDRVVVSGCGAATALRDALADEGPLDDALHARLATGSR